MRVLPVVLLVMTAACAHNPAAPASPAEELGTYALVSVGGNAVPCDFSEGGPTARITSGSLTLSAGGSVRIVTAFTVNGQTAGTDVSGTYTRAGGSLTMHYSNGGANIGTLEGQTFTMMNEGIPWVYRRGQ